MSAAIHKLTTWLASLVRDPNDCSASSARVCAVLCVLVGCGIAIGGLWLNRDQHETVAVLLGGGAANLFARTRSTPATPGAS